jgi:hypothetical protein
MAAPSYDDSGWPLFRIRLSHFAMSESEFSAYLKTVDDLFLRGDASLSSSMRATRRCTPRRSARRSRSTCSSCERARASIRRSATSPDGRP